MSGKEEKAIDGLAIIGWWVHGVHYAVCILLPRSQIFYNKILIFIYI